MNQITYGYVGCCPICGQAPVGGREYLCGHNPSTNQQSASADDPRDATIRELRALCAEGALAMQDQADALMERGLTYRYEMDLAAKFRAASAAPALAEPAKRLRKELGK